MQLNGTAVPTRLGGGLRRPLPLQRTTRVGLAVLLVLSQPLWAATIIVDETTCTLVDAITAANTDSAVGGCAAGSGADTVQLTTDVTLTAVNNYYGYGDNGLPAVASDITVAGGGFKIERSGAAPPFRFFAVDASGTITMNDVSLINGYTFLGGAIWNSGAVTMTETTISGNSASHGGGVYNSDFPGGSPASVLIQNSTISGNAATIGHGGGIFNNGIYSNATITVTNSTLSGNSANVVGGAISNYTAGGVVSLTNTTLSGNSGIGVIHAYGPVTLANTIVANSAGGSCTGAIIDGGNNFRDDGTCGGGGFGTITGLEAALADNGGPTLTHALLAGSSAIDAAGVCGLVTDQRGVLRNDGACDSGAYEFTDSIPMSSPWARLALGGGLLALLALGLGVRRRWGNQPT